MNDLIFPEKKWILAHNENNILHYVELEAGQHFASGQPVVEIFDDFVDCVDKIVELGYDPDEVICKNPYVKNI